MVLSNDSVNLAYRHLAVQCSAIAASAVRGQFLQLRCPHTEGPQPFLRRPMSLYGANPVGREVDCPYKVAGAGRAAALPAGRAYSEGSRT
jgi:dihydroorotate dehydrogenase electron transfer subunit